MLLQLDFMVYQSDRLFTKYCKPCWKTFGLPFTSNYHFLCYKACLLHWNEVSAFVLFCCQIMRRRSPSSKWRIILSTRRIPTLRGDQFILYTIKWVQQYLWQYQYKLMPYNPWPTAGISTQSSAIVVLQTAYNSEPRYW